MKTILIIITLLIAYSTSGFPIIRQNNSLKNYELKKILKKAKYESGYIIQGNDTISSDILVYRKRNSGYSFNYCIVKTQNDSIRILTPQDIIAYSVNNQKFISHMAGGYYYFIEQMKEGRVNLYYRGSIKNDNRVLYYLKFPSYNYYLVLSPLEKSISVKASMENKNNRMMVLKTNVDLKFKKFVELYFRDCLKVVNMVSSNYYTINDIPSIVEAYNNCFD